MCVCVCTMLICVLQSLVRFRWDKSKFITGRDKQANRAAKKTRELNVTTRGLNERKTERMKLSSQSTPDTTTSGTDI